MRRDPVKSSNLKSVGYDIASQTLEIEFHEGRVYQYAGVKEAVYRALLRAPSLGSYFHKNIRSQYKFRRIS